MISKNNEAYQTSHHPDDIFMVAANQLLQDNIADFEEKISSPNTQIGLEFLINQLNEHIKKSIEERAFAYKKIFASTMPSLVHVLRQLPSFQEKEIKDISLRFSRLENESDILSFARIYGLLGVLDWGWNNYSHTNFETLNTWHTYIAHIKRLLKLYKALKEKKQGKEVEVIGEFFSLEEETVYMVGKGLIKRTKISWTEKYCIKEMENLLLDGVNNIPHPAPDLPREIEESLAYDGLIGSYVLALLIKNGLDDAVKISFSEVFHSDLSPIGFSFNETYSSRYLLGAIYQDLWRLINTDVPIRYCNYCNRPFEGKGKKKHCNESCRQMAYKERKRIRSTILR
ncbi:hypothetical protein [Paenisporosarcina indica]|uniref:hypothetical protein n=1 Tax=Paenisporosarcina indica TaxID=650093 RepID=UPI00094F5713|nr:hypothetical protein [Paenisporosarcina indica]